MMIPNLIESRLEFNRKTDIKREREREREREKDTLIGNRGD